MNDIFLSYRRGDEPGYVARLADDLTDAFGDVVFRDVDKIPAGSEWKRELSRRVAQAKVLIAVIGRQWQSILLERKHEDADWIRFELNQARALDIAVIPVKLEGAVFDATTDMGDLNWLTELQFFELSDKQNRWSADVEQLIQRVAALSGLKIVPKDDDSARGSSSRQVTHGDQSPAIVSKEGDVNISYGDSKPKR